MIDDALAVAAGAADVKVVVLRVLSQVLAGWIARIEVADAAVVRDEVDAASNPHRSRRIALKFNEASPVTVAGGIDPQIPCGSSPISFPVCCFDGGPCDDAPAAGSVGDEHCRASRQLA